MLIGLAGYAEVGKDTAGEYLTSEHGFRRVAFADKLKELAYRANPWLGNCDLQYAVNEMGWNDAKREPEVREFLQRLGTEGCRKVFGEDFWVDQVLPKYKGVALRAFQRHRTVVSDVRFPNEAKRIQDLGGFLIRIEREGYGPVNSHVSEQVLDADYIVLNPEGDPDGLGVILEGILKEIS